MISFLSFAKELFHVPDDFELPPQFSSEIQAWETHVWKQITGSRFGYAQAEIYKTPLLEDQAISILTQLLGKKRLRESTPTLYLSHDVDYLHATPQMNLKRIVATKSLHWKQESYFDSLKTFIEHDLAIAGSSTFFVASPTPAHSLSKRAKQWLIDPSYHDSPSEYTQLKSMLNRNSLEVGVHGSFFSHELNLLSSEVKQLESDFKTNIRSSRQHWLNLPNPAENYERVLSSGIAVDSTLGWNGTVGFRGGVSRPLSFAGNAGNLKLVPMVLMDGPLFDDLKLSHEEAFKICIEILEPVYERSGHVSIDWHERGAHPSYNWFAVYEKVVSWARQKGFDFKTISQSIKEDL